MEWYNEPPHWKQDDDLLTVTSGAKTDFWRKTNHAPTHDNGHFYFQRVSGDFIIEVNISGEYSTQYDQAGLMLRVDAETWLKCGIEVFDGLQCVSVVITHDYSDNSLQALSTAPKSCWLRVIRHGSTIEVFYSLDRQRYYMVRQAYLTDAPQILVGMMTAAPIGDGFTSRFRGFQITR